MRRVFDANEGLCRRVARCFEFEDLSCSDIARVMMLKMEGPRARSHGQEQLESTTGIVTGVPPTEFPLQGFRYGHWVSLQVCLHKLVSGWFAKHALRDLCFPICVC